MDLLASGAGGEVTDVSFRSSTATSKPFWTLAPLPLDHVRPGYSYPTTSLPSLQSLALNAISTNFHLFSPADFGGFAPHLRTRVLERIKGDRVYELDADRETHRPDEATLWAYQTLLDPAPLVEHLRSITVGLPSAITLRHLAPNPTLAKPDHPLNEFPRLFRSIHKDAEYTLLTSLSLGGLEGGVSDQTILSLRYCTSLSILKTKDCAIGDDGIRMLATALDLSGPPDDPDGEEKGKGSSDRGLGMWRLRAWYLQGCTMITDKSMQSFARWPGLVLLDVRDTSCTSAACGIFNRASRALFACQNADFQPCTPGLLPLFAGVASPRYVAEKLCILLGPPYSEIDPFSLHVVPSSREILPSWLPPGTSLPGSSYSSGTPISTWGSGGGSVFRGDGIGQIYGAGVSAIGDTSQSFRNRVKTALFLTSRDEEEERDPRKRTKRLREEKELRKSNWGTKQPPPKGKKDTDPYGRANSLIGGKKYKLKSGAVDVIGPNATYDRSRTAYAMRKIPESERAEEEKVKGDVELMLVRMVCGHWEELTWAADAGMELRRIALGQAPGIHSGSRDASSQASGMGMASQAVPGPSALQSAKVRARNGTGDILSDILGTSSSTEASASQRSKQTVGAAFRPSQSSHPPRPLSSSQASASAFASSPSHSSQSAHVAALPSSSPPPATSSSPQSNTFPHPSSNPNPFRANPTNPFKSAPTPSGVRPLSTSLSSQRANRPPPSMRDDLKASASDAFAGLTAVKKRAFDGAAAEEPGKRRGMKMFSGARL